MAAGIFASVPAGEVGLIVTWHFGPNEEASVRPLRAAKMTHSRGKAEHHKVRDSGGA